jgi:Subtilase family
VRAVTSFGAGMRRHVLPFVLLASLCLPAEAIARTPSAADAVGAPAFWAAGFTGGAGPADVRPVSLLIDGDTISHDHPALAPLSIAVPPGAAANCDPSLGQCQHGTELAGMLASQDADHQGVAPGLSTLLVDGDMGAYPPTEYDGITWGLGRVQDGPAGPLVGASPSASVLTASYMLDGSGATDGFYEQAADRLAPTLTQAYATGNAGPAASTTTCAAYDVLCVGAIDAGTLTDPSDDVIAPYSSRGPTGDGRKKPDLVAVGDVTTTRADWQTAGTQWISDQGTSFAAPQVAGGAALLIGSGVADPLAVRAILIDSARAGRATPSAAMGTQTGWQPDWGWGELDLAQALAERTHAQTAAVSPDAPVFFRSTTSSPGDRATLVWNRRVDSTVHPLTQVSLLDRDPATCAVRDSSATPLDNVQQTRSPAGGGDLYEVRADSPVDGLAAEPFALAATDALTPLVTPQPQLSIQTSGDGGPTATITVTATNPSPDLGGGPLTLTLTPSPGLDVIAGPHPSMSSSFPAGSTTSATWTVHATQPGTHAFTVDATTSVCSDPIAASTAGTLNTADPTVPPVAVPAPIPPAPPTPPLTRVPAHLRIAAISISRAHARARLSGTLSNQAGGRVRLTLRLHLPHRLVRFTRAVAIHDGRFAVQPPLSRATIRTWTRATLTASYPGDVLVAPATASRQLRRARGT